MAAGPPENAAKKLRGDLGRAAQSFEEWRCFLLLEVGEVDALANVEWGPAAIADEIGGRGDADEAESDAIELGAGGALVVEGTDGGEEFVGGEGKTAHEINLVDERSRFFRGWRGQ